MGFLWFLLRFLSVFEEFEVCFGDFGDGVGEAEAFELYYYYAVGLVGFYLASDANKGAS